MPMPRTIIAQPAGVVRTARRKLVTDVGASGPSVSA